METAVEVALRQLLSTADRRNALAELHGIGWDGDLDAMRNEWTPDVDWGLRDEQ